jgi:hypothetical protein
VDDEVGVGVEGGVRSGSGGRGGSGGEGVLVLGRDVDVGIGSRGLRVGSWGLRVGRGGVGRELFYGEGGFDESLEGGVAGETAEDSFG